jgi:hypothetical protein
MGYSRVRILGLTFPHGTRSLKGFSRTDIWPSASLLLLIARIYAQSRWLSYRGYFQYVPLPLRLLLMVGSFGKYPSLTLHARTYVLFIASGPQWLPYAYDTLFSARSGTSGTTFGHTARLKMEVRQRLQRLRISTDHTGSLLCVPVISSISVSFLQAPTTFSRPRWKSYYSFSELTNHLTLIHIDQIIPE